MNIVQYNSFININKIKFFKLTKIVKNGAILNKSTQKESVIIISVNINIICSIFYPYGV